MSFLIQLLLPRNSDGTALPSSMFMTVRSELTEKFGGVTVYSRAAADGLWKSEDGAIEHDEIVLFEVMSPHLRSRWWHDYRLELEKRFAQTEIVIRAQKIRRL